MNSVISIIPWEEPFLLVSPNPNVLVALEITRSTSSREEFQEWLYLLNRLVHNQAPIWS